MGARGYEGRPSSSVQSAAIVREMDLERERFRIGVVDPMGRQAAKAVAARPDDALERILLAYEIGRAQPLPDDEVTR